MSQQVTANKFVKSSPRNLQSKLRGSLEASHIISIKKIGYGFPETTHTLTLNRSFTEPFFCSSLRPIVCENIPTNRVEDIAQ